MRSFVGYGPGIEACCYCGDYRGQHIRLLYHNMPSVFQFYKEQNQCLLVTYMISLYLIWYLQIFKFRFKVLARSYNYKSGNKCMP